MCLRNARALLCLLALTLPAPALTQSSMGTVDGTVTDATGGVLPGATVTLVSEATNVQAVRVTNESGFYAFVNVRPGSYVLTVELSGLRTARISGFAVGVNETVTQNVRLEIGGITEVMEVKAQSELLQTSSSGLGQVVEEKVIRDLPLQGRNFTSLLMLTPGVNPVSTAQGPQAETAVNSIEGNSGIPGGAIFNASVQGQQNRSKVYYVDGIINSSMRSGTYVALPDIDSLQEFKVQSQSDKAEYGGVAGGVVNMTSKSGTNRFSGSAFVSYRDQDFVARNPFVDVEAGKAISPPPFRQSQFGVNVGAPIVKNKTFVFASYDGWRFRNFTRIQHIVPGGNELDGDFSQNFGRTIYNPYSTRIDASGRLVRDPFPGNVIPKNLISPTMQAFLKAYMLKPNVAPGDVVNNYNFSMLRQQENNSNSFQVRLDHHFSAGDNVFFRWTERRINAYLPRGDVGYLEPDSINRNAGGGWFHSFSTNKFLEVRGGIATQPTEDAPMQHPLGLAPQQGLNLPELDKFQGYILNGLGTPWNLPTLGVQGPRPRENPNWNAAADLSWLRGKQNMKFGFQILQISRLQKNQFGEIIVNADPTRNAQGSASTGDPLAAALLGLPNQVRGYVPDVGFIDFHTSTLSGYFQNQWAMKPTVTLTYGLRYDYVTRAIGDSGTMQSGPDLDTGEWLLALPQLPGVCGGNVPPPCLPTELSKIPYSQYIRATGERNSIIKPIADNWGPRVGVAWQINRDTVLRTGYSLLWDAMVSRSQYAQHQFETWGWPQVSGFDTATMNTIGGANRTIESLGSLPFGVPRPFPWNATSAYFNDPDRKDPYSHQWHVEVQRQFTQNLMLGAAYVGSYNGRMEYSGRAFAPKTAAIDPATGRRLTPAERDQLRPWPHITTDARYSKDLGMSKYNAFEFKAQQRYSQGLSSMLSYTYSRSIDTSSGWFAAENGIGGGGAVQNYWDIDDARAVSSYDIPHLLTWGTVWELPAGAGKRWLTRGPASWILGGWQMNWMLLARSGQPMTVTVGGDPANLGFSGYSRPNAVQGVDPVLDNPTVDKYFNPAAYAAPVNSFGNVKRNSLRAPAYWNVDLGLQKNIPLTRGARLEIRAEAFNVFNHINWGNPNTAIDNVNVGRITSMSGRPRQFQLGGRLTF